MCGMSTDRQHHRKADTNTNAWGKSNISARAATVGAEDIVGVQSIQQRPRVGKMRADCIA